MSAQFLVGAAVLSGGAWLAGHGVLVADGRIAGVLPAGEAVGAVRVDLPPGSLLAPGLVDIQVNGGGGVLFNDRPDQASARAIAAAHRRLGTTQVLATLITDTRRAMQAANLVVPDTEAGVLGLHFEGPFISPERPGVHPAGLIRTPDEADLEMLCGRAGPVLVTLAPECVPDPVIGRLAASGVRVAAGHSAASCERVAEAVAAGLSGFTHLFNAMPPLSARQPGVAGAALADPETWCGVIADGIHVHPAMLRLLLAAKPGRTILVSDAMPPTGTAMTEFQLQGRTIHRTGGRLHTADGTLAGADICLADAVRFCVRALGVPAAQAIGMASEAPAAFLGLDGEFGRIAPGARADLLLLDETLAVLGTWLGGDWQSEAALAGGRSQVDEVLGDAMAGNTPRGQSGGEFRATGL